MTYILVTLTCRKRRKHNIKYVLSWCYPLDITIDVSSLRLSGTGGTGPTAVTAGLPHKEIFAFGNNNTGRNSTEC